MASSLASCRGVGVVVRDEVREVVLVVGVGVVWRPRVAVEDGLVRSSPVLYV